MIMITKTLMTLRTTIITHDKNHRAHGYVNNSQRTTITELEAQAFGVELPGIMLA